MTSDPRLDPFVLDHRGATWFALDRMLEGDFQRGKKILKIAARKGTPQAMRAYARQWFRNHADNPVACDMKRVFDEAELKNAPPPPKRIPHRGYGQSW